MSLTDQALETEDLHPIDVVEALARANEWDFERTDTEEIAMAVAGQWRTYTLTLSGNGPDPALSLLATFEMEPPAARLGAVYETLNRINVMSWTGAFGYLPDERLMTWRYVLDLSGDAGVAPEQVERMIATAVTAAERFYPALALVAWSEEPPAEALQVAIAEAYGRA